MGYDVTKWRTKRIERLQIPLSALYDTNPIIVYGGSRPGKPQINSWHAEGFAVGIRTSEFGYIQGRILFENPDFVLLKSISLRGQGSGAFFEGTLLSALEASWGVLEAVLIWEGGDEITRLTVEDGEVAHEEIEL